jgi:molybdopterin-guanine dinucleotide biosynthesis protein A
MRDDNNLFPGKVAQERMVEKVDFSGAPVPAMILAGGRSRRMGGGDKGLLLLGDRPILGHVIDRIRPQVMALALNANGDPARFAALGLDVIPDPVPGFAGPLAGILAALSWAAEIAPNATHVLTVPSDTPFLPRDLVLRLQAAIRAPGDPVVAARQARRHPVVGLWPVGCYAALEAAVRRETLRKVEAWTDRVNAQVVSFDDGDSDPFFNVNTPADLAAAGDLLGVKP